MAGGIKINMSKFKLDEAAKRQRAALGLYAQTSGQKMEAQAKVSAPWTDRTTHARQSITGDWGWQGNLLKVILSGGMYYSVFLELAHEKKYAVLVPTVNGMAPEILRGYQRLVKG
jgi:hypothetical protein